jgi:hypothetical protein
MIRSFRSALIAMVAVAACMVAEPVSAQTFTLAEMGLENAGACPKLAVRDRASNAMVPLGCITSGGTGPDFKFTPGSLTMQGALYAADLSLAGTFNPPAVMAAAGNRISFCPELSCVRGPGSGPNAGAVDPAYFDHQRASLLLSGPSQLGGQAQEQLLAVIGTAATGSVSAWQAGKAYAAGAEVNRVNSNESGAVYRARNAGTSGTNPPPAERPQSLPYSFNDGGVTWDWINDPVLAAKASVYVEQKVKPGAGGTWGQATNVLLDQGLVPSFHVNTELDIGNNSGTDCGFGNGDCFNLFVRSGGSNMLTGNVQIESVPHGPPYAAYFGLRVTGPRTAKYADIVTDSFGAVGLGVCTTGTDDCTHADASIADASKSPISLHIRQRGTGTMHSVSAIVDDTTTPTSLNVAGSKTYAAIFEHSTTPISMLISGTKSTSSIVDDSTSPTALNIAGTKSIAGIYEHSTTPAGINLSGTYSRSQIEGTGWNVSPQGVLTAAGAFLSGFFKPAQYTAVGLPACNASGRGAVATITDAGGAINYRGIIGGGGSAIAVVLCDGANWIYH